MVLPTLVENFTSNPHTKGTLLMKDLINILISLEIRFTSKRIKPIFHLFEKATGVTPFGFSKIFSAVGIFLLLIFFFPISIESGGISTNPLLFSACTLVLIFQGFYFLMIWNTAHTRHEQFKNGTLKEVANTQIIFDGTRRLVWLLLSTASLYTSQVLLLKSMYLPAFMLFPLSVCYPALLSCGIFPYHRNTKEQQTVRVNKLVRFVAFLIISCKAYTTIEVTFLNTKEKVLIGIVLVVIWLLVVKATKPRTKTVLTEQE